MSRHNLDLSNRTVPLSEITKDDLARDVQYHGLGAFVWRSQDLELIRLRHPDQLLDNGSLRRALDQARSDRKSRARVRKSPVGRRLRITDLEEHDKDYVFSCEFISNSLDMSRYDPRYLQIEAGDHQAYLNGIAQEMQTKGSHLFVAARPFVKTARDTTARTREDQAKTLIDAIQRRLWTDRPRKEQADEGTFQSVFLRMEEIHVKHAQEYRYPDGIALWELLGFDDVNDNQTSREGSVGNADLNAIPIGLPRNTWTDNPRMTAFLDCSLGAVSQVQGFQKNEIATHPISGEILSLSLCGTILRVIFLNPLRYGTSRGYDLTDQQDWLEIVKIIALFAGPVTNYLQYWRPQAQEVLKIQTPIGDELRVKFKSVQILDKRGGSYGKRTTVWSCEVSEIEQFDRNGDKTEVDPRYTPEEGEVFVIKASWLPSHLADHEKEVYQHIEKGDRLEHELNGFSRDADISISVFLGTVVDSESAKETLGSIPLSEWKARPAPLAADDAPSPPEHASLSVFATKCFKAGTIVGRNLPLVDIIMIYRKLFKTLKYLAKRGVHYRDMNLGNILRDLLTGKRCLVADFDSARIGTARPGDPTRKENEPWEISMDDCVSGNLTFMSTYVQEGREAKQTYQDAQLLVVQANATLNSFEEGTQDYAKAKSELKDDEEALSEAKKKMNPMSHRYIDDCESALYTLLWLVADAQRRKTGKPIPQLILELHDLNKKKTVWQSAIPNLVRQIGADQHWGSMMGQMNKVIRAAQIQMRERQIFNADLHKIETQCFEDCDRIMIEAIKSMVQDAGLAPEVQVEVGGTQPQTDRQERQEERHDDPEEHDGTVKQKRELRRRKEPVNYKC